MDVWRVELGSQNVGVKPLRLSISNHIKNSQARTFASPDRSVSIINDGSRWDRPIERVRDSDQSGARWLLILDSPSFTLEFAPLDLTAVSSQIEHWNGNDVYQLVNAIAEMLGAEFAFVLFDSHHRRLIMARDPIGSRPLYWRRVDTSVVFSSSRELLVEPCQTLTINPVAVAVFLGTGGNDWTKGEFLVGFHRLEAGSFVDVKLSGEAAGRWWMPLKSSNQPKASDIVDTTRQLRAALEQAISSRARPDLRIGAHVSGGIDSTGVAALAARQLQRAGGRLVAAYAWSPHVSEAYPDMGGLDERRRIQAFAANEGINVRFGGTTSEDFVAMLQRPIELEGIADLADEMHVLRTAKTDGIQIMMSGWGGDEAFSSHGAGYLAYLLHSLQFERAVRWLRSQLGSLRQIGPVATMLWWQGIHPMLPDFLYRLFDPYTVGGAHRSFLSPDLLRTHRAQIDEVKHGARITSKPSETLLQHFLAGHVTERIESWDVWSRAYGFHYTYPLTDKRLLESLLSMPPEQRFPGERSRGLALEVLGDAVPPGARKYDLANEAFRRVTREGAWKVLAAMERDGQFDGDCPWLDMKRLRSGLSNPADQSAPANVLEFLHIFNAVRVWHMWKRHDR